MCELMGMCFERAVSAEISIQAFGARSEENADGWGLAWYPDRSLSLVKEPAKWAASAYTQFLKAYRPLKSSIYVAHVRHRTTGGEPTHSDTHPFSRECGGQEYCFAHNGTLEGYVQALPLGRFRPIGHTDSEHLFCWLLDRIADEGNRLEEQHESESLQGLLRRANELGRLNCLFSDGKRLFAYRDRQQWKGLSFLSGPLAWTPSGRRLEDNTVQVELEATPVNEGVVVATSPLNEHPWQALGPGRLLVVQDGRIVFGMVP